MVQDTHLWWEGAGAEVQFCSGPPTVATAAPGRHSAPRPPPPPARRRRAAGRCDAGLPAALGRRPWRGWPPGPPSPPLPGQEPGPQTLALGALQPRPAARWDTMGHQVRRCGLVTPEDGNAEAPTRLFGLSWSYSLLVLWVSLSAVLGRDRRAWPLD